MSFCASLNQNTVVVDRTSEKNFSRGYEGRCRTPKSLPKMNKKKTKKRSLKFSPIFCPKFGEDQKKKFSLKFSPIFSPKSGEDQKKGLH